MTALDCTPVLRTLPATFVGFSFGGGVCAGGRGENKNGDQEKREEGEKE